MKWWFEIKTDSKHVYILPQNDQGQKFVFVKVMLLMITIYMKAYTTFQLPVDFPDAWTLWPII